MENTMNNNTTTTNAMNMFEYATRHHLRFVYKGIYTVEDLWDLTLETLDNMYQALKNQIKKQTEVNESLLEKPLVQNDETLEIKLDIIKYVFDQKHAEQKREENAEAIAKEKAEIQELIARKQKEAMQNASVEELQAMLAKLEQ